MAAPTNDEEGLEVVDLGLWPGKAAVVPVLAMELVDGRGEEEDVGITGWGALTGRSSHPRSLTSARVRDHRRRAVAPPRPYSPSNLHDGSRSTTSVAAPTHAPTPPLELSRKQTESLRQSFERFDQDGSGDLDLDEIRQMVRSLSFRTQDTAPMSARARYQLGQSEDRLLANLMTRVDTDRSGSIDLDELATSALRTEVKLSKSQEPPPTCRGHKSRRKKGGVRWTHSELLGHSLSSGLASDLDQLSRSVPGRNDHPKDTIEEINNAGNEGEVNPTDNAPARQPFGTSACSHKKRRNGPVHARPSSARARGPTTNQFNGQRFPRGPIAHLTKTQVLQLQAMFEGHCADARGSRTWLGRSELAQLVHSVMAPADSACNPGRQSSESGPVLAGSNSKVEAWCVKAPLSTRPSTVQDTKVLRQKQLCVRVESTTTELLRIMLPPEQRKLAAAKPGSVEAAAVRLECSDFVGTVDQALAPTHGGARLGVLFCRKLASLETPKFAVGASSEAEVQLVVGSCNIHAQRDGESDADVHASLSRRGKPLNP